MAYCNRKKPLFMLCTGDRPSGADVSRLFIERGGIDFE
jgi:hypothetical protein